MKKKLLCTAISLGLCASIFSGCDNSTPSPTNTSSTTSETTKGKQLSSNILDYLDSDTAEFLANGDISDVLITYYDMYGEGGLSQYATIDNDLMEEIRQAILGIEIVEETFSVAEDYSEGFDFQTSDKTYSVCFNQRNLEVSGRYFVITNDKTLWKCIDEMYSVDETEEID